jgi:DNA-binding PadR family transcriptional regulator
MSTPSIDNADAPQESTRNKDEGERRLREHTQLRNAARQALRDAEQERQQPRLKVKAKADRAAAVTTEALGVHDSLPDHHVFNTLTEARTKIAKEVQQTFAHISQALGSTQLDGTQAVTRVAELGREALGRHMTQVDSIRQQIHGISGSVDDRIRSAMQPPAHLAGMMQSARDALRAMPAEERSNLMARAKGDTAEVILYAVGGAPAFLSGVHEGKRMQVRMELIGVRDPDLLLLEPGMKQALAALDKMQAGITRLIGEVADFDAAKALTALRA